MVLGLGQSSSVLSSKSNESARRKSCLRSPGFEVGRGKELTPRRSKFEEMDVSKIDGKLLGHEIREAGQEGKGENGS